MKKRCGMILTWAVLALVMTGCASGQDVQAAPKATEDAAQAAEAADETAEPATEETAQGGLTIALEELSETPKMIDWTQDGVAMQLIALKDADGAPRLAYNTCQVCAGSPYAYFEYQGGMLVCQNCGNAFPLSSVGIIAGGCNPMPVGEFETQDGEILLSGEELSKASASFRNWKAFQ